MTKAERILCARLLNEYAGQLDDAGCNDMDMGLFDGIDAAGM